MKKLTFLLSFFWVFTSMAQFEMPAFNPLKGALVSSPNSLNSVAFNRESLKTSTTVAPVNYRLDWRYMITSRDLSNGQADSLAYYSNPLFMDSTAIYNNIVNSVNTPTNIDLMKAGSLVDPKSPNWDPNYAGNAIFTSSDAYTLDTIFVGGYYRMVAGDKSVGDTLFFEVAYGDTVNGTFRRLNNKVLGYEYAVREFPTPSGVHGHNAYQQPSPNYYRFTYILTAKDTVTVNNPYAGLIVVKLPNGGLSIPANNIFSVTYTYIPGAKSSYKNGNAVYGYGGSVGVDNGFAVVYGINNGKGTNNYFKDMQNYYNEPMEYYNWQQYHLSAKYGLKTFLDSVTLPEAQLVYELLYTVTKVPTGEGIVSLNQKQLSVAQNYPNPCNTITYIGYELPADASVSLTVYDLTGKSVASTNPGMQFAGNHTLELNTSNLQSGVYFYTFTAGESKVTKRLTVIH